MDLEVAVNLFSLTYRGSNSHPQLSLNSNGLIERSYPYTESEVDDHAQSETAYTSMDCRQEEASCNTEDKQHQRKHIQTASKRKRSNATLSTAQPCNSATLNSDQRQASVDSNVNAGIVSRWQDPDYDNMHQDTPSMENFINNKLEVEAGKNWHRFYKRNQANFYKDRHYLHHAFPGICRIDNHSQNHKKQSTSNNAVNAASPAFTKSPTLTKDTDAPLVKSDCKARLAASDRKVTLVGFGCGVGNALFPLAAMDSHLHVIGLDFAAEAIRLFRKHDMYDGVRIQAYVQDLVNDPFIPEITPHLGQIDKVCTPLCSSLEHM